MVTAIPEAATDVGVAVPGVVAEMGVGVRFDLIGPLVEVLVEQASAIQIKKQSIKPKLSMFFTSTSQTFEILQHRIP